MTMTDPISDLIVRIKNASNAKHAQVLVPSSKFKIAITDILKQEGYIENYQEVKNEKVGKSILIDLKFDEKNQPIIHGIKRVSKPGLRKYAPHNNLPKVLGNLGTAILSTSSGVLTDKAAKSKGVGGEVVAFVW